jgi:hypothetical protein
MAELKQCSKCHIFMPTTSFMKDKSTRDGLYSSCKSCKAAYRETRKPQQKVINDKYRAEKSDEMKEARKSWRDNNKNRISNYNKNYRSEKKDRIRAQKNSRYHADDAYRLTDNLRSRLKYALNGITKSLSTFQLVGMESGDKVIGYLYLKSPQFENVPFADLEVDHIIPCSIYDFNNPDHQRACFHFTNLQLLMPDDNRLKSDNVPENFDFQTNLEKQLELIDTIESSKLSYEEVLEMQNDGRLFEVINCSEIKKNVLKMNEALCQMSRIETPERIRH